MAIQMVEVIITPIYIDHFFTHLRIVVQKEKSRVYSYLHYTLNLYILQMYMSTVHCTKLV